MKLSRSFFLKPTVDVAKTLLGKKLVYKNHSLLITETEAYVGQEDPACHAARGKTKRTEVMFGKAGVSYIYLIYGMYHCLNFVTEEEGFPAAVLIRGGLAEGVSYSKTNGPGKLCRHLGLDCTQNAVDLITSPHFYVEETGKSFDFDETARVGISKGLDKMWRFIAKI